MRVALAEEVGEADRRRFASVEAGARQRKTPGNALAHSSEKIRRDLRRRQAKARLGQRKAGAGRGDDDVRGGGKPHAAAHRRAVDDRDGHERQRGETSEKTPAGGVQRLDRIRPARRRRRRQGLQQRL